MAVANSVGSRMVCESERESKGNREKGRRRKAAATRREPNLVGSQAERLTVTLRLLSVSYDHPRSPLFLYVPIYMYIYISVISPHFSVYKLHLLSSSLFNWKSIPRSYEFWILRFYQIVHHYIYIYIYLLTEIINKSKISIFVWYMIDVN